MGNDGVGPHVLIIGAGLGGLTLAQCFRKNGVSFEIFERDADEGSRPQGWAIAIHSVLGELQEAVSDDMPDLRRSTNHLAPLSLAPQICFYTTGSRIGVEAGADVDVLRANRTKLRQWLSREIPIQWGKRLVKVEQTQHGRTVAYFDDGTTASGDILVGADGVQSVVREHMLQVPNKDVIRAVPVSVIVAESIILSDGAFERQLELGHSAYVVGHPGTCWLYAGLNQACADGRSGEYYWHLSWRDDKAGDPSHWLRTASREDLLRAAKDKVQALEPRFRDVVEVATAQHIYGASIYRDVEINALPTSHTTLLGDAAHPMAPFRGEGGVHAMRDALNLAPAIAALQTRDSAAVRQALEGYQLELVSRGAEAVRKCRGGEANTGQDGGAVFSWGHWAGPIAEETISLHQVNAAQV